MFTHRSVNLGRLASSSGIAPLSLLLLRFLINIKCTKEYITHCEIIEMIHYEIGIINSRKYS
jgi:hypothetical protein